MIWVFRWLEWLDDDEDEDEFLPADVVVFGVWLAMGMMPLDAMFALMEAMSEDVLIEFMLLALAPIAVGPMEEAWWWWWWDEEFCVMADVVAAIVVTGSEVDVLMLLVLNELGME